MFDATCWPRLNTMLENVGRCWLEFKLLKIFIQHRATLLAQQCYTMLPSSEQAFKLVTEMKSTLGDT